MRARGRPTWPDWTDEIMRIHGIDAIAIDIPLKKNFGGSTYSVLKRSTVITRLRTDDGVESEVYNGDNRAHSREIARMIREEMAPLVVGMDVFASEAIWAKLFALSTENRDRKTLMEAIACVDCAVWDVVGKASGRSVRELLGGFTDQVPIISIGGYYMEGKTLADIGREMEAYRRAGMAGCKFKVGGLAPARDAERVAAARKAAGPDFLLAVDANRGWTAEEAIEFAHLVEPLDIRWFEEPCHWYDDAALMARVRAKTRIPITAGQSEITSHGVRRLIDAGAVDIVNYDASEGGGVTDWRRAAALAANVGVAMAHHEESQISQHLIAAVPHGTCVECFADPERDPVRQSMWVNRPPIKDGMMQVATGPGFGLELDAKMIEKYRVG
jgi:D-galactarolactone cycloisomerase